MLHLPELHEVKKGGRAGGPGVRSALLLPLPSSPFSFRRGGGAEAGGGGVERMSSSFVGVGAQVGTRGLGEGGVLRWKLREVDGEWPAPSLGGRGGGFYPPPFREAPQGLLAGASLGDGGSPDGAARFAVSSFSSPPVGFCASR